MKAKESRTKLTFDKVISLNYDFYRKWYWFTSNFFCLYILTELAHRITSDLLDSGFLLHRKSPMDSNMELPFNAIALRCNGIAMNKCMLWTAEILNCPVWNSNMRTLRVEQHGCSKLGPVVLQPLKLTCGKMLPRKIPSCPNTHTQRMWVTFLATNIGICTIFLA